MNSSGAERFIKNWDRIHGETSRVLRAALDDKMEWRPRDGMFTMRELVNHIVKAEDALVRSAIAGSTQKSSLDLSGSNAVEISNTFDSNHRALVDEVRKLNNEQWASEVEFHDRRLRRGVLLWFVTEHEIHHRGQLFTYYRLAGIEPPDLHA